MNGSLRPAGLAKGTYLEIQHGYYMVETMRYASTMQLPGDSELALVLDRDAVWVATWTESGRLKLWAQRTPEDPGPPPGSWDQVLETTVTASGPLFVRSWDSDLPTQLQTGKEVEASLTRRRGTFRLRLAARGRETVRGAAVAEGEEHFLQVWRVGT